MTERGEGGERGREREERKDEEEFIWHLFEGGAGAGPAIAFIVTVRTHRGAQSDASLEYAFDAGATVC